MTSLLLAAALAATLAVPPTRHGLSKAAGAIGRVWVSKPPAYCNERTQCCLRYEDCGIIGFLPKERQ